MPRLAGVGSRYHDKSNTLRQQQQHLADILVQVPPNLCTMLAVVWGIVVVVLGGGCAACIRLGVLFSRRCSFFLYRDVSPVSGLSGGA